MMMVPPTLTESSSKVSPKTVERALNSLLKWRSSKSQIQKPQLLDHDEFIYLILTLKKIPAKDRTNAFKIPLPHPLHSSDSELCLIVDDRTKSGLTKDEVMKKVKAENIPVSKVLKLSKLKSNYRPFEAKRKLCDSFDMFLADKRVLPLLPRLLGKQFFKKKKIPVPVDLKHKNWKEQIEKALGSALFFLRTGTCSVVRVAKASMSADEILQNVIASISGTVENVPKKWGNVRSLHLKLLESVALPIYQAVPDMKLKIVGVRGEEEEVHKMKEEHESVGKDVTVGKKKGRLHEVRYMDMHVDDGFDGDDLGSDGDFDVNEGKDSADVELVKKRRKKGVKTEDGVPSECDGLELLKKSKKVKDKDGLKTKKDKSTTKVKDNGIEESEVGELRRSKVAKPKAKKSKFATKFKHSRA